MCIVFLVVYVCQTCKLDEFFEWIQENKSWNKYAEKRQKQKQQTITIDPSTHSFDEEFHHS